MNKDKIKDITEAISNEINEITRRLQMLSTSQLTKYISSPNKWNTYQYASIDSFTNKIKSESVKATKQLNRALYNGLVLAYALSNKDFSFSNLPNLEEEKKKAQSTMKLIRPLLAQNVSNYANAVVTSHVNSINRISVEPNLKTPQELYERICTEVNTHGGVDNVPKVTYADGREISWNAYMDMNVRTTVNQEVGNFQIESSKRLNVVFYICSTHISAPDHEDYQGKIYFDEDYHSFDFDEETMKKIEDFISSKHLMSIQSVRDNPPYLTTRPNCRHKFQTLTLEEALNDSEVLILKNHKLVFGKHDAEHYKDLEQQRYNERQIRRWKGKLEERELELKNAPNGDNMGLKNSVESAKSKVREWQKKQREFLKDKDYLERDYNRETNKLIKTDLGADLHKYTL